MLPTVITFALIAGALVVLVGTLLTSRRHNDPSSSVEHFSRALAAMGSGGESPSTSPEDTDDSA